MHRHCVAVNAYRPLLALGLIKSFLVIENHQQTEYVEKRIITSFFRDD